MGDDTAEMTVWGQGAEESGKTGWTGVWSTWSNFHLGLMPGDLPPFRIRYKDDLFPKTLGYEITQWRTDSQKIVVGMRPIIRAEIPHEAGELDLLEVVI